MLPGLKPSIIGKRYELHDPIGQGGMGAVYRAVDRLTGNTVALKSVLDAADKVLLSTAHNGDDFRLALAQEFKLLASLRHPHIIQVLDYGFDEDQVPYFTMELLEAPQDILQAGADQPLMTKINIIVQTLRALAYLHRRGILHRDVKPANILVVEGQVKVLDFGLSVMRDRSTKEEDTQTTAGTLAYMAPEVLMGYTPTEQADLYAVGMIFYELIAGQHPFNTQDIGGLINDIIYTLPDLSLLDVDDELVMLLQRMLQKDPTLRFANAREVITTLDEISEEPIVAETLETRESFLQAARLVGRERELNELRDSLVITRTGRGSVWLVGGENGVGKSRLVDELRTLALVDGAVVMRGQAVSEGRSPYQMWRQVLSWLALLGTLDPIDAGLVKLLVPDVITLPEYDLEAASHLNAQQVQARLLKMLTTIIQHQTQPIVMIIEDLHWANSESISLLAQMNRQIDTLPLMIIATYRDDERPDLPNLLPDVPNLKLKRLSDQGIAELSEAILGEAGKQVHVVNLLRKETEGNVFFLIEVVRALAQDAGHLEQIGLMTLPQHVFTGGVETIIQRRLDALPKAAHRYLQTAAIIGRQLDLEILKAVEPEISLDLWLMECANTAVLEVSEGEWRFAHDKLRDGILKQVSDEQRRHLHAQVAEAMERLYGEEDRAAALAYHWGRAEDPLKEGYYVALAGDQALRSGAYQEAVTYFERGLELLLQATLSEETALRRRINLQNRQAEAYLGFGRYEAAEKRFQDNLGLSKQIDSRQDMAKALYALGDVAYATNKPFEARQYYRKSLAIYQEIDNQAGIARALNSLGNVAYDLGDQAGAKTLYQRSLAISRELGSQWGMAGSALLKLEQAAPPEDGLQEQQAVRQKLTQTLETYIVQDDQQGMAVTFYDLGQVAYDLKDYDEALVHFNKALIIYRHTDDMRGVVEALNRISMVLLHQAEYAEARQNLTQALKTAEGFDVILPGLDTLLSLARLELALNEPEAALALLAFIINHENTPEAVEDKAERLIFDLETALPPDVKAELWEQGKNHTFSSVVRFILNRT